MRREGTPTYAMIGVIMVSSALLLGGLSWYIYKGATPIPGLRVVNVLPEDLHKDAHITGSINVPMQELEDKLKEWSPTTTLVFYCSNYYCQASMEAAQLFRDHGFPRAYAYEGGTAEWYQLGKKQKGFPTTGPAQASYLTMQVEPQQQEEDSDLTITAQQLQRLMEEEGLIANTNNNNAA